MEEVGGGGGGAEGGTEGGMGQKGGWDGIGILVPGFGVHLLGGRGKSIGKDR